MCVCVLCASVCVCAPVRVPMCVFVPVCVHTYSNTHVSMRMFLR